MHPAFLYLPGDRLTQPELCAARLDGHVVELGEAYIPADLVEGAALRAAAVAALILPGSAASGPTAAWIHGAGDAPPTPHHARRAVPQRIRPRPHRRLVFHDTPVPASDVTLLGGVAVTTPLRTMIDLALGQHRDPTLLPWARSLAAARPGLAEEALHVLRSLTRVPGTRAGVAVLERLAVRTR
ncbi:hypothetical protein [Microbacterium hydrocarbonoxydans]|uniref:hypothetical protein n=1 Tax=Microbacterium hydrocarbonoxydans TaxID=273678 RepID=UPI0007BB9CEC|nr:hypothetical protein [Microbacterium hydrocarbonoxydans]GAT73203.1 SAM-dependent methyltransferase [Microbacterium sp. HM58-2]